MKSQQLAIVLLILGAIAFLYYSGFVEKSTRNIVIDGYADEWKGIYSAVIYQTDPSKTITFKLYRFTDEENLYIMIKPAERLNDKIFIFEPSIPNFSGQTDINPIKVEIENSNVKNISNVFLPKPSVKQFPSAEYKDVLEIRIPLSNVGIDKNKDYEVLITEDGEKKGMFSLKFK